MHRKLPTWCMLGRVSKKNLAIVCGFIALAFLVTNTDNGVGITRIVYTSTIKQNDNIKRPIAESEEINPIQNVQTEQMDSTFNEANDPIRTPNIINTLVERRRMRDNLLIAITNTKQEDSVHGHGDVVNDVTVKDIFHDEEDKVEGEREEDEGEKDNILEQGDMVNDITVNDEIHNEEEKVVGKRKGVKRRGRIKHGKSRGTLKAVNPDLTDRGQRKFEMLGRMDMFEENRTCRQRLPDAIIFGVMKAGTEAFSTYLTINPDVAMSLNVRSTLFFTQNYHKGLGWYRQQMTCSTSKQKTIEKAPQYFSEPLAPMRIYHMNRNIKLILLVRNPIDRAISHYLQVKNSHPKIIGDKSFEDIVFTKDGHVHTGSNFIALSRYSTILKRWYQYFKRSQILVLDGDTFKQNQIKVLSKAEQFLNIKPYITSDKFIFDKEKGFYCLNINGEAACLGDGKGRTHPELQDNHYHTLKAYFKPYNEELYKMTGKHFNW